MSISMRIQSNNSRRVLSFTQCYLVSPLVIANKPGVRLFTALETVFDLLEDDAPFQLLTIHSHISYKS